MTINLISINSKCTDDCRHEVRIDYNNNTINNAFLSKQEIYDLLSNCKDYNKNSKAIRTNSEPKGTENSNRKNENGINLFTTPSSLSFLPFSLSGE